MNCHASVRLVVGQLIRRLRRAVRGDIARACNQTAMQRPDAASDQVGILQIADADGTVIALTYKIHEAVAVGCVHVQQGMAPCHVRKHRGEVGRTKGQRRCDTQPPAQIAAGQDGIAGRVDFRTGLGRMDTEGGTGLGKRSTARGPRQQLHAHLTFEAA